PSKVHAMNANRLASYVFLALWMLGLLVPIAALVAWSFIGMENYKFVPRLTLDAYETILASARHLVVWQTLRIAITVTIIDLHVAVLLTISLVKVVSSAVTKPVRLSVLTLSCCVASESLKMSFR